MTNHVHLVLDPPDKVIVLSRLMKRLAGRQTRYANQQERRSGTLWEGRYKSSPIQTESYLLACCRYVELNPMRARMVADPGSYRWSSYSEISGEVAFAWLDDNPCYLALGNNQQERWDRYKQFVRSVTPDGERDFIRRSLNRGQLTGNHAFIDEVERMIGRRIEHRAPGNQPAKKMPK